QNNGGPTVGQSANSVSTLTEALGAGSAAINTGNNALVPNTVTTDQRGAGFARIVNCTVDVGAYEIQSPPAPPPPPGPPPPPPGAGLTTITTIVSVQNTYPGLIQLETVTVDVTNPNGFAVNEGIVTFQVNGQTVVAPVVNGTATVTIATGLFDFGALF